ncbi:MAG TPA: hypothetical protein VIR78_05190 [Malonomonas sp.]
MVRVISFGLLLLVLSGCGAGKFQLSKQEYQAKVQVLGVLPLLVDRAAPLAYPQGEAVYDLLTRANVGKYEELVAQLKKKKGYFDVRGLPDGGDLLTMSLLSGTQPVDAQGRPYRFAFNQETITELTQRYVVDALLIVVFSGAQVDENRRSRNLMESLRTSYTDVLATAAVVGRDGKILWQLNGADSYQALPLQYADFDEAYYNRTNQVQVKNISLAGVERMFVGDPGKKGPPNASKMYAELFGRISSGISPGLLDVLR